MSKYSTFNHPSMGLCRSCAKPMTFLPVAESQYHKVCGVKASATESNASGYIEMPTRKGAFK